jgi:F-type H+-transporting ATPase subunit a
MEEHLATWLNAIVDLEPEGLRHVLSVNVLSAWLVIAVVLIAVRLGTRRMELRPTSGWQVFWEWACEGFTNFAVGIIGPGGERHAPYLGTLFIYIVCMNLLGLIPGFVSPTASLVMTFSLSIPTFFYVQMCGFRAHGARYLMHFVGEPLWLAPINLIVHTIGEIARPVSLAVRLFGNIFGEDTVIAQLLAMSSVIFAAIHVPIPLHFPMVLFHIFVSFVQALVFMMLTAAYIAGAQAHEGEEHEAEHHEEPHAAAA